VLCSYLCRNGAILACCVILNQCGASSERKDLRVPPSTPQLKSIVAIIESARHYTAASLPNETHQSYPVPVRTGGGIRIAFLYCVSRVTFQEGLQLLPPSHLGFVNAETAVFEEFRAVRPADFGRSDPENQFLGKYRLPEGMTQEEYLDYQARLFQAYDRLLPQFAINQASVSPETKRAAGEFKALFNLITEQILRPYYQAIGNDFFAWLDKVSS
jgi:hypothetical protein